ncbi:unnamed protein product [Ectocarpus sp. CCAP 1310/34]|nr:unnamed protein product [Ectocarpus sp. CCAP 1310/34]
MIWAETFSHFLWPEDLAEAIDEDPEEINMILRLAKPILRAHGIIPREFRGRMAWCLVGIGPMYLTLSTRLLAHAMSAEPNGLLFGGTDLRSNGLVASKGSVNLTKFYLDSVALVSDVHSKTKCRRCGASVPVGGWTYVRLESVVFPLLNPGEVAEVGIQFRCQCGAIHVGEPLPTRGETGEAWSLSDIVVEAIGHTCPEARRGREGVGAGSNTDNNAELASKVRTGGAGGGRREAGVCAACLAAGVRRDSLLSNKHARKGPKICLAIQKKIREEGGHTSTTGDDSTSEDGSASDENSSEHDAGEEDTDS